MALPTMIDVDDIDSWTSYLRTKPAGAMVKEAEGILGKSVTDGRKLSGLMAWGFIQREGDRVTLTADGRSYAIGNQEAKVKQLRDIVLHHSPYLGTIEWAVHNSIVTMTSADVVARWLDYYRADVGSDNEHTLNRMAVCFFYLLQGALFGNLTIGRRGLPTRFDVDLKVAEEFVYGYETPPEATIRGTEIVEPSTSIIAENADASSSDENDDSASSRTDVIAGTTEIEEVFVGHGKNEQILGQVKELLTYGRFVPVVAEEEETTAVPVPRKVLAAMRRSQAGVINVSADEKLTDDDGNTRYSINQNVLTEIGAAFVLYDERVVLLTDRRVELPSNLQGIYRCEYEGESLDFEATMRLLKALNRFRE